VLTDEEFAAAKAKIRTRVAHDRSVRDVEAHQVGVYDEIVVDPAGHWGGLPR
jgi:hypothetical protein